MRVLIRAELMPFVRCWHESKLEDLRVALALALATDGYPSISGYTPVAFPEYAERWFWLWLWDGLFHENLPSPDELAGYELDFSIDAYLGRWPPDKEPGEWNEIFEVRNDIRFRMPTDGA